MEDKLRPKLITKLAQWGFTYRAIINQLDITGDFTEANKAERDFANEILALIRPQIEAEARQQVRQEVFNWMFTHMVGDSPEHEPYRGLIAIKKEMWQSQLKEWGIEA